MGSAHSQLMSGGRQEKWSRHMGRTIAGYQREDKRFLLSHRLSSACWWFAGLCRSLPCDPVRQFLGFFFPALCCSFQKAFAHVYIWSILPTSASDGPRAEDLRGGLCSILNRFLCRVRDGDLAAFFCTWMSSLRKRLSQRMLWHLCWSSCSLVGLFQAPRFSLWLCLYWLTVTPLVVYSVL